VISTALFAPLNVEGGSGGFGGFSGDRDLNAAATAQDIKTAGLASSTLLYYFFSFLMRRMVGILSRLRKCSRTFSISDF